MLREAAGGLMGDDFPAMIFRKNIETGGADSAGKKGYNEGKGRSSGLRTNREKRGESLWQRLFLS